jgi:hypothetical protein
MEETIINLATSIAVVVGQSNPIAIAIGTIAGCLFSLFGGKK